jgi:hypothetical protein
MIDAKGEQVAAWYRLFGAVPLNDTPLSLLLPYDLFKAALARASKPFP